MNTLQKAFVLGLACTIGLSYALPASVAHAVHEERLTTPARWTKRDRVRSHALLPMRIGLVQSNLENAYEYLMDVSHPSSSNYGKHWTSEQVINAFRPSDETVAQVREWLLESGIRNNSITQSDNKAWFAFYASAEQVEALLHTEYHEYEDLATGGIMPACERYHIPKHIQKHIDYIHPGIRLMAPTTVDNQEPSFDFNIQRRGHGGHHKPHLHHKCPDPFPYNPSSNLSTCDIAITPACIAALYKIPPGHLASPDNVMGIFEAELQFWDQKDLNLFFANFTPQIPKGTHPSNALINGGVAVTKNLSLAGGESMLDLELAYPIVYPQTIKVFNVDDLNYQTWDNDTYTWGFNTLLDAIDGSYCTYSAYGEKGDAPGIDPTYPDPAPGGYKGKAQCGVYKPTNVISLSYGGQEADVPIAYQKRQCNEYLKLGLQGVSFLFASGDAGVANYPEPYGTDGPTGCLGPNLDIFNPTWPNTCPYITNVGATKVYPGYTVFQPESAVYDPAGHPYHVNYSSGGGFSNVYPVPDYQKSALSTYFSSHNPPYPYYSGLVSDAPNPTLPDIASLSGTSGGIYNRIGRGVPDVAANGDNIAVYVGGKFHLSGGTSASTPIFASIINRIIDERIARGKGPLGFLNPALYENPWVFNDITNGSNPGCGTIGFSAVEGWDPVTGLGTPNYPKMLKLFLSLP